MIRWLPSCGLATCGPFQPIDGFGAVGGPVLGAAPAGRMEPPQGHQAVQSGQEGGQGRLVWCTLVQQPWQLLSHGDSNDACRLSVVFHAKKHLGVLAVSTHRGTKLLGQPETAVPMHSE